MKKTIKIILVIFAIFLVLSLSFMLYYLIITSGVKLDSNKLINIDGTITYYDTFNTEIKTNNGKNDVVSLDSLSSYIPNAFISIEDKRFYSHHGIDYKGLFRATFNNIKSFSFKEGASTITQQLIKNTHLSSEKTLNRKLIEIKLSRELEKKYSKQQILEMYLNTIYFGNNCFGISSASDFYFSKRPGELSIAESALLAGIIKAPSIYSPTIDYEKCLKRRNTVLKEMLNNNAISSEEYENNVNSEIRLNINKNTKNSYIDLLNKEVDKILPQKLSLNRKYNIYTSYNPKLQEKLENKILSFNINTDKSCVLLDKNSNICAYFSTIKEQNRQMGSTVKPILVYAPCIEEDIAFSCTKILDEKTTIDGYTVNNYKDKYYGYVSIKESLEKSLNTCAVKLLNSTGIEKSISYINKTDIKLTDDDKNLSIALGNTKNGATLKDIVASYNIFSNKGYYISPKIINKITDENGKILYENPTIKTRVFSDSTVSIMNDMLSSVVENGTAKKLSTLNMNIYGKTGTVGNEKGNTDAYCISYTNDYALGVWLGNADSSYMPNEITGGYYPTELSADIWKEIYNNFSPKKIEQEGTVELFIDKISYDIDNKVFLANCVIPKRYVLKKIFKENYIPNDISSRFICPNIENAKLSVVSKGITIDLCVADYYNAKIYKMENGQKHLLCDTKNIKDKNEIVDSNISFDKTYIYSIIPYYFDGNMEYLGEEKIIGEIKMPRNYLGSDDWWMCEQ